MDNHPIIFAEDLPGSTLHDRVARGELMRLARGIYTADVAADPIEVVRRSWRSIVGRAFPGAVVTDRSSVWAQPHDGYLFVASAREATLGLPGLVVVSHKGPGAVEGDIDIGAGVYLASRPRALLDNTRPTRLDRLTNAYTANPATPFTSNQQYGYDPAGNRTSQIFNGLSITASFNAANQLTSRGEVGYSYDANGNQIASSAGAALAYNGADQTTSLKRAGGTALPATYAGGNQVERATAGTTSFTNTLLGVSAATVAGATTATTRDPAGGLVGLRNGSSRSYFLFDGLGSVAAVTNAAGSITNSYKYDPYGVTTETNFTGAISNPWRYAGQYFDTTTGLYKMGARYYQPELGRWTQPDPSGLDAKAYLYVGGNPVNFVDPSGTAAVRPSTYGGIEVLLNMTETATLVDLLYAGAGLSAVAAFFGFLPGGLLRDFLLLMRQLLALGSAMGCVLDFECQYSTMAHRFSTAVSDRTGPPTSPWKNSAVVWLLVIATIVSLTNAAYSIVNDGDLVESVLPLLAAALMVTLIVSTVIERSPKVLGRTRIVATVLGVLIILLALMMIVIR